MKLLSCERTDILDAQKINVPSPLQAVASGPNPISTTTTSPATVTQALADAVLALG